MIEIIPFEAAQAQHIRDLNVEWLSRYFAVEPGDEVQLGNPQAEILDRGGQIFYARCDGKIVGTATLMRVDASCYELSKMAVTAAFQGRGIGRALLEHCLHTARTLQAERLILYSNTRLEAALHLYRQYGFQEVPMDATHYRRANIRMELNL